MPTNRTSFQFCCCLSLAKTDGMTYFLSISWLAREPDWLKSVLLLFEGTHNQKSQEYTGLTHGLGLCMAFLTP